MDINFPYTAVQLTEQVDRIPNSYGLIRAMGLFSEEGSISTIVEIRLEDGKIRVLPAKERGAPASQTSRENGKSLFLQVPHFPDMDLISPQDLQDLTVIRGNTKQPKTLADEVAKRLKNIRANHDITLEWLRMCAIKGILIDGDNNTLYNLFDVFGITQKTIDFTLGTGGTDIIAKCAELNQYVFENLKGETMQQVEVLVSPTFFNKLVQHANVAKFWLQTQAAGTLATAQRQALGGNWGRVFEFQSIMFREYFGAAPIKVDGVTTSTRFVEDDAGYAYPTGTQDVFKTWFAPANDIRFVNTVGQQIYISPEILKHGAGVELKSESDPLCVAKRPEVLAKVYSSN